MGRGKVHLLFFIGFLFDRTAALKVVPQSFGQAFFTFSRPFGFFCSHVRFLFFSTHKGLFAEIAFLVKKLVFKGLPR